MNIIVSKFKEVLFSILPITVVVMILNFTISPMETTLVIRYLIGALLVILGLTAFLLGVDIGIAPLGDLTGRSIAKSNKLWIVLIGGLILGFFISIAEPGLMVFSSEVNLATSGQISGLSILVVVSIGLAIMLTLGFLRILYNIPLYKVLFVTYIVIFGLAIFTSREFLAIAFDASGATTGVLAVPFILAISAGISKLKKDSKASENDSFGLMALASTGAIMSVMILGIFSKTNKFISITDVEIISNDSILGPFFNIVPEIFIQSLMAIAPLLAILLVLQKTSFKMSRRDLRKLLTGFGFAFVGLFIFLVGVNAGFMEVGRSIGNNLTAKDNKTSLIIIGFVLGFVTMLAEPAVHILTRQIEEVTSGYVNRRTVLIPLATGVGFAIILSVMRVLIPGIQLWHYLLPGYIICITMMFFIPKLFVGIAFDAGGVATGPVTATFILAFMQGVANAFEGADVIADGFGMIAMVALFPIITLEILGLVYAIKSKKKGVEK